MPKSHKEMLAAAAWLTLQGQGISHIFILQATCPHKNGTYSILI
tara:strand:- start:59 stop:190 length:132 start_codon:yes stop_codon:yes gene_type:complete